MSQKKRKEKKRKEKGKKHDTEMWGQLSRLD